MTYRVEFARSVKAQMLALKAADRRWIIEAIERRLQREPLVESRNRKPLRPNPVAPWELRVGRFRVFYEVAAGGQPVIRVLAVGEKKGNVLCIGGKGVRL